MRKLLNVSLCTLAVCICSCIVANSRAAGRPVNFSVPAHADTAALKPIDTISVEGDYTVYSFSDSVTLRFHFTVITPGGTALRSAAITSDFTISKGFVSHMDARRTAMIVIARHKAGETSPAINKQDLTDNHIPQQEQ